MESKHLKKALATLGLLLAGLSTGSAQQFVVMKVELKGQETRLPEINNQLTERQSDQMVDAGSGSEERANFETDEDDEALARMLQDVGAEGEELSDEEGEAAVARAETLVENLDAEKQAKHQREEEERKKQEEEHKKEEVKRQRKTQEEKKREDARQQAAEGFGAKLPHRR